MYNNTISPGQVQSTLERHVLADGYDLTFDMERSQGVMLYDSKHQRALLDLFTCFASVPIGYNHPKAVNDKSFKKSLLNAALNNPSNSDIYTAEYAYFLETFSRIGIPDYLPHAFFVSGGALAVENALKVAMDWKVQKNFEKGHTTAKGTKVIHFEHAFHGRSGYTLSLTNTQPEKTKWFAQFGWPRVSSPKIVFPLNDENLADVKRREERTISEITQIFADYRDEICAIILEPIQAEGGENHFRVEFMEALRRLADEHEALLIYDEVQTGVGLTGKFWAHEHFGERARPDIIAFGKKMQVCGILAGRRIDEIETNVFRVPSRINSTWGGNLADMVRATKFLQIIEEDNLVAHAATTGDYLAKRLQELAEKYGAMRNIRNRGLFAAFDFPNGQLRDDFLKQGLAKGVLFLGCGTQSIRFRPALIIQAQELDQGLAVLESIVKDY